ncbi:MAG: dipeptidase [Acidobacteria bacterium]|nr:dipeptidase [Acidobacteriota bacterium]MBI3661835.1 dipeptidase [Acidobacteriota bacterium]
MANAARVVRSRSDSPSLARKGVREANLSPVLSLVEREKERVLSALRQLIAIPSISTKPENRKEVERCAEWLATHLSDIGMTNSRIVRTAGHPVVTGEWRDDQRKPELLVYGHYDVQPPEPLELWSTPPFEATIRDNRIYGRGTTDDKGQFFIHLKAIEAYLRGAGTLPVHVKVILEGEEEIGSPHLGKFLAENKEWLRSDVAVISDTPFFAPGVPSICYGLRGNVYMEVEVVGPHQDLHSGSHGGAVHNPIQVLAEIIAQLHDHDGRITIPGFYDDVRPLSTRERKSFRQLPWSDARYARELGVRKLYGERGFTTLERLWARPTLDCHGIWGGFTSPGSKTVIPSKAVAKISMRIVPDQRPEHIAKLFTTHAQKLCPQTARVSVKCLHTGEAALVPLQSPGVEAAAVAMTKSFGKKPVYQREGGSIPIITSLKRMLGIDTVLLGFGLPDENAHAPNEFLDLGNFFGGILAAIHFYDELSRRIERKGE